MMRFWREQRGAQAIEWLALLVLVVGLVLALRPMFGQGGSVVKKVEQKVNSTIDAIVE